METFKRQRHAGVQPCPAVKPPIIRLSGCLYDFYTCRAQSGVSVKTCCRDRNKKEGFSADETILDGMTPSRLRLYSYLMVCLSQLSHPLVSCLCDSKRGKEINSSIHSLSSVILLTASAVSGCSITLLCTDLVPFMCCSLQTKLTLDLFTF